MPLPLEKSIVTPNALMAPQIILRSAIMNGRLVTSAQIILQTAKCDNGVWTYCGGETKAVEIADIENLDADIASLAQDVGTLFTAIVTLIGTINAIRKVL